MNGMLSSIDIRQNDLYFLASPFNPLQENSITRPVRDLADGIQAMTNKTGKGINEKTASPADLKARFDSELSKMDSEINGLESGMKIWIRRTRIWPLGSRKLTNHPDRKRIY
ncbi:MAG: hypothetical protein AB2L14_34650 [Candidatus Xenobiia bacterium LiM19]